MDSASIKFLSEGEWKRKKHAAEYRWQWCNVHLGIDAHTLGIQGSMPFSMEFDNRAQR